MEERRKEDRDETGRKNEKRYKHPTAICNETLVVRHKGYL